MNNLVLKRQHWTLDNGAALQLEWGNIGEVNIQVPWTQLNAGHVEIAAQNVHMVIRPVFDHGSEYLKARESVLHALKMVVLPVVFCSL